MSVNEAVKLIIKDSGRTQTWLVTRINNIDPCVHMNNSKLSASLTGKRKITADEFIALCKALEISPDLIADKVSER